VLIDWFTVVAEVINFLILLWLLKRFLYKPILNAMAKRESTMTAREQEAIAALDLGREQQEKYDTLLNQISSDREEILAQAHLDADDRRRELTQQAASDVAALEARWKESLGRERLAFSQALSQRAGEKICNIAQLALADLAEEDLEHHIVEVFTGKLGDLEVSQRSRLMDTIRKSNYRVTITTSFRLDDTQRAGIDEALKGLMGRDVAITYETSEGVICGVDLRASEYRLAFSLGDYLERLRTELSEELQVELSAREGG